MLDYTDYTLILAALEHYESCGATEDIANEFQSKVTQVLFGGFGSIAEITAKAQQIADECKGKQVALKEQVVLLRAKLIMARDAALAEEAI